MLDFSRHVPQAGEAAGEDPIDSWGLPLLLWARKDGSGKIGRGPISLLLSYKLYTSRQKREEAACISMQPQQPPQQPQQPLQQQQQHGAALGGDASADKEVMAILSSPLQQKKFVVKPQPRPGGAAPSVTAVGGGGGGGGGALGPASPRANGNSTLGGEYRREVVAGAGRAGVPEAVVGASPPQTPGGLPKSTSASWDPQVQSSSSAFSIPAGRGGGGGAAGRVEGSGGAGGAGGIGSLTLGGFRSVGGDPFQVRGGSLPTYSVLHMVQQ